MATLDVVANGRLTLMVALGWQPKARAAYGMPWKERVPRFEEALRILRLRGRLLSPQTGTRAHSAVDWCRRGACNPVRGMPR